MSVNTNVTLVTIYQVVCEDNDGRESPSNQFFEKASDALEKSKPGTWSGQGRPPKAREGVRFPDGTIRLLGDFVTITPDGMVSTTAEKAERDAAKAKLTRREREILGIRE
jgi:hypothetical protein